MTITQQEIIALAAKAEENAAHEPKANYVTFLQEFAKLVASKETQGRQAAQLELEQYRSEAQQRAGVLIKEAYQRGVRDEREACASICDDRSELYSDEGGDARSCAAAIRARSDK